MSTPPDIFLPCGHPVLPEANLIGMHILTTYIRLNCCQVRSGIHCTNIHYTNNCVLFNIYIYFWMEKGVTLAVNMRVMGTKSSLGRSAVCVMTIGSTDLLCRN